MSHTTAPFASLPASLEEGYASAVSEELRSHDDIATAADLELAPVFTPEDLDFSDYRWSRGDTRSQRDIAQYESGHSARDFF